MGVRNFTYFVTGSVPSHLPNGAYAMKRWQRASSDQLALELYKDLKNSSLGR